MFTSLDEHFKCHFSTNDNNLFDGKLIFDKMCDSAYQKPMFWCKLPTYSVFNSRGLPGGVCFYTSFF